MDNTSRVAQWRQKMRDEGKESMTIWLSRDAKLRLEDMASVWRVTPSEMIAQALEQFHPGSPQSLGNVTDIAQLQTLMQETVRALWPELKQELLQELHGNVAVTAIDCNVTETLPTQEYEVEPAPSRRDRKLTPRQIRALRDKHLHGVKVPALMEEYSISRASVFRYLQSDKR